MKVVFSTTESYILSFGAFKIVIRILVLVNCHSFLGMRTYAKQV